MNKKFFIKSMETLKAYNDWEYQLYELGVNFWERDEVANLIVNYSELLAEICHCDVTDEYGTDIDYFMYETDWGKNADKYFITETDDDGNNIEIKLHTIEDLWNYLVKEHPEIDEGEPNE